MISLRDWQRRLSNKVINLIREGNIVLLQAPTGSGKTLFSLYVGFEVKEKILFVTRTHNEFYPVYREVSRFFPDKKFGFIIGKPQACPLSTGDVDSEDISCKYCDLMKVKDVTVNDYPSAFLQKLKNEALEEGFCPYYTLFKTASEANVIVVTYPYLFIPWLRESLELNLPEYFIIIDEAHNIDNIVDLEERRINENTITFALKEVKSERAKDILLTLKNEVKKYTLNEDKYVLLDNYPKLSYEDLHTLEDEYEDLREEMVKQKKIRKLHLTSIIKFYRLVRDENARVFTAKNSLIVKPIDTSTYLDFLNQEDLSIMLMSGTLQRPEYFKALGLTRKLAYIDAERELKDTLVGNYDCAIALDVTTSYPLRNESMWKKYASYLLKIYYASLKNVLAIFPSYEVMNNVNRFIKSVPIIAEGENTSIEDVIKKVAEGNDKYLITGVARGKLSEGIELVKDGKSLISDIVIAGIPYPVFDDYLKLKLETMSKRLNKDVQELVMDSTALVAVKQAIGRGIRSPSDFVHVWLLDRRFDRISWKKKVNCFNPKKIRL